MPLKRSFLNIFLVFFMAASGSWCAANQHLAAVFTAQRAPIGSFIDNVLRQIPSTKVIELVDRIMQEEGDELDDALLYTKICDHIAPLRGRLDIVRVVALIRFQKQLLGGQIRELLEDTHTIEHCLEIGTPGTYTSTIADRIGGTIYALLDKPQMSDFLQAQSLSFAKKFKGYHEAIPLNDYEVISTQIPDNSIDLIICTIGLHHCPPQKLDAFIASIKRVLRPGGIFLLREHNAHTPDLVSLAYAAHSIYNVIIPQETLEAEMQEVRNFQSLADWKQLLEFHGFIIDAKELLQDGDSTLNTFVRCNKQCVSQKDYELNASMKAKQHADYVRDGVQTYLTTPEWNNVDAAQQYGEYINTIPFYEFPYMAHVKTFWKTFMSSWRCAAQQTGGSLKMLTSPNILLNYTLMNVFIGTFMTIEYSAKAAVSLPIRAMFSGVEATTLLALVEDPNDEISHVDPSITIKATYDGGIKLVSIPRYMQFLASVKRLTHSSVNFVTIANNETILCKIRYKHDKIPFLKSSWVQKFTWQMPTLPQYTYAAYLVPVRELKEFVGVLEHDQNSELLYLHDF